MFDDSIMSMSDYFMRTYRFFYWHVKLNELKYTEVEFYNIEGARQFMRVFREEDNPSGYWRKLLSMTKQHEMFIYRMSDDEVEHEIAKMLDKGYIKVCLETVNHSPFGGDYDPDDTGEITCYDPTTYKKISDDRAIRKPTKKAEEKPAAQKESKPEADSSKSSESSKPQVQENTATTSNAPGTTLTGQPALGTKEQESVVKQQELSREGTTFIDKNNEEKFHDVNRKVRMSENGKVIIQYGNHTGEEKTVILSEDANTIQTRDGITLKRDKNGFPVFNSKFDTFVPDSMLGNQDQGAHFQYANERLRENLKSNPSMAKEMGLTEKQVEHFMKDPAVKRPPANLTWHHHQDTGRMQLVPRQEHEAFVPHTGGMSVWGGGYKKKK